MSARLKLLQDLFIHMMQYRSRPEITAMILESARMGATKTRMMYNAYLSHTQVIEYMKFLQKSDLLTYEKDTQLYRPTEKGLKFLNLLNVLGEIVPLSNSENHNTQ
jgi:predicted transcriptional regulator